MPPHEPAPSGSDDSTANSSPAWGTNGSGEALTAVAEAPPAAGTPVVVDATDATPAIATEIAADDAASDAPADDGSAFLAELTRAMQATAGAERERVTADIERRRKAHLAAIQTRRAAEIERMRKLADGDLEAIDAWADGERQRIDRERETKAAALRDDLKTSLAEHGSRIDREVQGVERAIAGHRTEIDAFFADLDRETDPVTIAQHAGLRPGFPDLESIETDETAAPPAADAPSEPAAEAATTTEAADDRVAAVATAAVDASTTDAGAAAPAATATATATETPSDATEAAEVSPGVGVMDKGLSPNLAETWASWSEAREPSLATDEETEPATASAADTTSDTPGPEELEVVAVTSSASRNEPGGVLQSIPVSRPMSWLRRGSNSDHSNTDS